MQAASRLMGIFFLLGLVSVVIADEPAKPSANSLDSAAMAELMAKLGAPGKPHEHLQAMVGKYKTISNWIVPGENEESVDEGTAEFKSILGGRFVTQQFKSTYNGEPMEGFGILGYDNAEQKFVGIWIDNMSTHILHTEGKLDDKTGVMTETGTCSSPIGTMNFKMTTVPTDDGFVFTLSQVTGDTETEMGKIKYVKQ
ncbi:hypothetical protein Pan97_47010 [Bremerella volcania]|uniref:DUF1579 domain-containing protein n=1 Tax=Bremerella volcania TaxID=2527984 RepID=A0A518CEI5_9BACT|nr:DUF1579 domain-containing protein [Bremerella volcania]QDU77629.1 hypothetical protein Pan97_47010 [Bremerella volcania]